MADAGARPPRIAVVGAGVAGLATAHRLVRSIPAAEVVVLEAGSRPGGKLRSAALGDLILPAGADAFVARKPWAVELCRELGIDGELEPPGATGAYLWTRTGLVPFLKKAPFGVPGDVGDVLRWPGLSAGGRWRALQDLVRAKRKEGTDESLGALLRRRLGDEATDRSVAPLLGGLFAGDVDRLSVQATFPELAAWERAQGSLIRGSQASSRTARRGGDPIPMFVRPRDGVERLTDVLAERIGRRLRTGVGAGGLSPHEGGFQLDVDGGTPFVADVVVLANEAPRAATILDHIAPGAADELRQIPYASTGVVLMSYGDDTARGLPSGTGFVVPRGEAPMTASTWLSNKWPREAFGSRAVLRCYVGGVGQEDILDADDADLIAACARFMAAAVSLPDAPARSTVVRWPDAMPQYGPGHLDRVARIRQGLPAGVFVTGQAYDGVGIPDCVRGAHATAEAVAAHLAGTHRRKETVP